MRPILFCPRCKKPVEAKDFMNPLYLGALDSLMPQMSCRCGYNGFPLSLPRKEYAEMLRGSSGRGKGSGPRRS